MSQRHLQCRTCGVIRPETEARSVPTYDAGKNAYVDGYYCDPHASAALATARAHIAGLDLDDDERDDMMPLVLLHALLRARGQMSESLPPDAAGGEGMERVRQTGLALLDRLREVRLPIVEPGALCSGCFRLLPASQIRVIPWFNEDLANFVTTFRCGECVAGSLAETRAKLEGGGAREIDLLAGFLGRHAITIHEHRRGDPPEVVRPLMLHVLGMIERGEMTLSIGETVPIQEAILQAPAVAEPASRVGPAAAAEPVSAREEAVASEGAPSLWQRIRRAFGRSRD